LILFIYFLLLQFYNQIYQTAMSSTKSVKNMILLIKPFWSITYVTVYNFEE